MAKKKVLPDTVKKWQREVSKCKLDQETIHGATLASASKITLKQFLLLHVLVKECKNYRGVITMLGIENLVKQSNTMLGDLESWNTYCNNFWSPDNIAEGTFAVARDNQLEVQKASVGKDDDELLGTPVQFKTREVRARQKIIQTLVSSMANVHLGSPAEKGKGSANIQPGSDAAQNKDVTSAGSGSVEGVVKGSANVQPGSAAEEDNTSDGAGSAAEEAKESTNAHEYSAEKNKNSASPEKVKSKPLADPFGFELEKEMRKFVLATPPTRELIDIMFPPTKDEQIVNSALIFFLKALILHFRKYLSSSWMLHRKAFHAVFDKAEFEARTDGYLEDHRGEPSILVEVKPVVRETKPDLVQMQESAQMVAWIASDDKVGQKKRKKRVHIAQDRHEIYISVAVYDDGYLDYLHNTESAEQKENPSFLEIYQFGPWDTLEETHMRYLGPILLAISLWADKESKELYP
ncbi:uncharacterized protein BDV14DRAFT_196786 [Aspergillus stella-maris]|uniref:uncharacterized protein n=1 Tax=Aspergillus stella-maris TaxID=1810926 RepID=UPI003CCDA14A